MSDFINTIDEIGDDTFVDGLLERTLTEIRDDVINRIGLGAFGSGGPLRLVDVPSATSAGGSAFSHSCSLSFVNIPNVQTFDGGRIFYRCTNLERLALPKVQAIYNETFGLCRMLSYLDFGELISIDGNAIFDECFSLQYLVIRSPQVCSLSGAIFGDTPIASGSGHIYVPSALIDSYKSATNWSVYATQFRPLEDYTSDGTVNGSFNHYRVKYSLVGVDSSNTSIYAGVSYNTTLSTSNPSGIGHVRILMSGDDITSEVYDHTTGDVNISSITGDIEIIAAVIRRELTTLYPYDGSEVGKIKAYKVQNIPASTIFELTYFMTEPIGMLFGNAGYDGTYWGSAGDISGGHKVDRLTTVTRTTLPHNATVSFSTDQWGNIGSDGFAADSYLVLIGKYLTIAILEGE